MGCDRIADEGLQADKVDVLYGEADVEARARLEAHLRSCAACREEMSGLAGLRRDLRAWRRPAARPTLADRGLVVPRWLAAAALVVLGLGATLGTLGYVSLRGSLSAQEARAEEFDRRHREAVAALQAAVTRPPAPQGADAAALLASLDARIDERLRATEARQGERLELRLADWEERLEAQRRIDMARVAAGLSYLDGRHGQQLARTNELVGYVLEASQKR
jgi:hypothetical protein